MKKIISVVLCGIIAVMMIGCTAESEPNATPTSTAVPSTTPTPAPTPTPTPEPAQVILMDIPEAEAANCPVPEAYKAIDAANDASIPVEPGFTIYNFEDVDGVMQYRAYGQKINPSNGAVVEQGFYALTISDEPLTAQMIDTLPAGERIVIVAIDNGIEDGHEVGDIIDSYILGDPEKPFDKEMFEQYGVIRKVITFDALAASPVNLEAEATIYAPEPTPEPEKESNSGNPNGSSSSGNSGSSNGSSSSGNSGSSNGSSSSSSSGSNNSSENEKQNLEDQLPDEFEVEWDGDTFINNEDWYN